jgi:uncharacterized membrane protein (UPF0127 family)
MKNPTAIKKGALAIGLLIFLVAFIYVVVRPADEIVWHEGIESLETRFPGYIVQDKILKGENFRVVISNKNEQRIKGLSDQEFLNPNEGMLFIFSGPGLHNFWMKDMNFSIDIIWLNEKLEVLYIEKDVEPESYTENNKELFGPKYQLSKYVFEVKAGVSDNLGIKVGDSLESLAN